MSDKLQKKAPSSMKEKSQYGLTFGVIAMMLFVAGFPLIVICFFGVFAYFLWKTFSHSPRSGVREIFEFYLSANEILRSDERKWYGFEVQEVISKGEHILQVMHGAPPLVYFALGALYNKVENHDAAVKHLSYVVEEDLAKEASYIHPSADLRNYVRVLRGIERNPSQSPQTSASIRALERARKNRGEKLLSESRTKLEQSAKELPASRKPVFANSNKANGKSDDSLLKTVNDTREAKEERAKFERSQPQTVRRKPPKRPSDTDYQNDDDLHANRKPITEVLHDIYDKNIQ
ncbi:MAG: hypothetical protein HKN25_15350 [Pyrinomonadaceae bacterium]|nr:hypothetical protein [Pyrinomonadaceae bacterium]